MTAAERAALVDALQVAVLAVESLERDVAALRQALGKAAGALGRPTPKA